MLFLMYLNGSLLAFKGPATCTPPVQKRSGLRCCPPLETFTLLRILPRAKRSGLLFTGCQLFVPLNGVTIETIQDEKIQEGKREYTFTDGCGFISPSLADRIQRARKRQGYVPSVYQIRYKGFKGVLVLHPDLCGDRIQFRESMKKFETPNNGCAPNELGIVEYSRPSGYGFLNLQLVRLLSSLGVPDEVFLHKQKTDLDLGSLTTPDLAFKWAVLMHRYDLARQLLSVQSAGEAHKLIVRLADGIKAHKLEEKKVDRMRVLIPFARTVFGVADPSGKLEYGECYFRPVVRNAARTLINGHVVVARNPCYHAGDIRVLKVVDIPELAHLVDCIVFPIKGKRPHPDEMAGGDLDGDKYFVSWDPLLLPSHVEEPFDYSPDTASRTSERPARTYEEMMR